MATFFGKVNVPTKLTMWSWCMQNRYFYELAMFNTGIEAPSAALTVYAVPPLSLSL